MKTTEQLNTQIEQTVSPNTQGLIDAQKVQDLLKEVVDSGVNKMTDAPLDNKTYALRNGIIYDIGTVFASKLEVGQSQLYFAKIQIVSTAQLSTDSLTYIYSEEGNMQFATESVLTLNGENVNNIGQLVLITQESNSNYDENRNGIYEVINYNFYAGTHYTTLSKDSVKSDSDIIRTNSNSYITNKKRYTALSGEIQGTFYNLL